MILIAPRNSYSNLKDIVEFSKAIQASDRHRRDRDSYTQSVVEKFMQTWA
jgi:hypothetical protein